MWLLTRCLETRIQPCSSAGDGWSIGFNACSPDYRFASPASETNQRGAVLIAPQNPCAWIVFEAEFWVVIVGIGCGQKDHHAFAP